MGRSPGFTFLYVIGIHMCKINAFFCRVLVLDAGKVSEYDTPANLLQSKGIFFSMARDAGLA